MNLKTPLVATVSLAVGIAIGLFLAQVLQRPVLPASAPTTSPSPDIIAAATSSPEHGTEFLPTQTDTAPPAPEMPSPEVQPSSVGTRPVLSMEAIGTVGKMFYHRSIKTLFMAVYEHDGTRAIWKLPDGGKPKRVLVANNLPGEIVVEGDSRGHLYAEYTNPAVIMRSDDEGATWKQVLGAVGIFWAITDDGNGTLYGTLHEDNEAILYRSTDDGLSWQPWKDFQAIFPDDAKLYNADDYHYRLRHLHDVIVSGSTIMVGTGDVARYWLRSDDGGETWRTVWDEGFTSGIAMSDPNVLLLGPDQLNAHGIARYDVPKNEMHEVWNPIPYGWAGFVYSMLNAGGFYYTAVHTEANAVESLRPKYGIIVSPDGERWYPLLTLGPVTNKAATSLWLAGGQDVVYISIDGSLYTLPKINASWFVSKTRFGTP